MTSRREFLTGAAGVALAAAPLRAAESGQDSSGSGGQHGSPGPGHPDTAISHGGGINGPTFAQGATVDHEANGFNPSDILRDFDLGQTSTMPDGRTLREWSITAIDKEIEVAPGVVFPAWTLNGRIPGPTLRCTEGDRLRVRFTNSSAHPHTLHFHGIHPADMDGVPMIGRGVIPPARSSSTSSTPNRSGCTCSTAT